MNVALVKCAIRIPLSHTSFQLKMTGTLQRKHGRRPMPRLTARIFPSSKILSLGSGQGTNTNHDSTIMAWATWLQIQLISDLLTQTWMKPSEFGCMTCSSPTCKPLLASRSSEITRTLWTFARRGKKSMKNTFITSLLTSESHPWQISSLHTSSTTADGKAQGNRM